MKPASAYPYVSDAIPWLEKLMEAWWGQHYLNPESYPRDEIPMVYMPGAIKGGPKYSGDVKGLQRILFEGEKPWTAVGTTRHVEGRGTPVSVQDVGFLRRLLEGLWGRSQ